MSAKYLRFIKCFIGMVVCLLSVAGCRHIDLQPPTNLAEPGWQQKQGFATWRFKKNSQAIAGELLVAVHNDGRYLIQFEKNPFPMVSVVKSLTHWNLAFPCFNKAYSGKGKPPDKTLWFFLVPALERKPLPGYIRFERQTGDAWQLEHRGTGELLEGVIAP